MHNGVLRIMFILIGIALLVGGHLLITKVERFRFERTNQYGTVELDSFRQKKSLESAVSIGITLKKLGGLAMIIGIVALFIP